MRDDKLREHIAMEVRVAMLRNGVSQAEFARILGCAQSTLSAKLNAKTAFTIEDLPPVCAHLGIDILDLFPEVRRVPA